MNSLFRSLYCEEHEGPVPENAVTIIFDPIPPLYPGDTVLVTKQSLLALEELGMIHSVFHSSLARIDCYPDDRDVKKPREETFEVYERSENPTTIRVRALCRVSPDLWADSY